MIIDKFQERKEATKKIDKAIIIITVLMLAIIPNIMYKKEFMSYSPILQGHHYETGAKGDIFNYYKAVFLYLGTFFIFILFNYRTIALRQTIKKHILNYIIPAFGFVILLSILNSDYINTAFFGNSDRMEGGLAWICYAVIFFVIFNINIKDEDFKLYYYALIAFIVLNAIFSITYTLGNNLLEKEWLNNLLGGGISGYIITTLYNPNFGSGMSAVVYSITFMYSLLIDKLPNKVFSIILACISYAMLLCMISVGGLLSILITMPVAIVIGIKFRGIKETSIFTSIIFILNTISFKLLNNKNKIIYEGSYSIFEKVNEISSLIVPVAFLVFFMYLVITILKGNKKIFVASLITLSVVSVAGYSVASIGLKNHKQEILSSSIYQKLDDMSSGRITIWIKTMNVTNDSLLFGDGFDTFPFEMIDKDEDEGLIGKDKNIFADKPHNWYLTIMYGSGVIALALVLAIAFFAVKEIFFKSADNINSKYIYIFGVGTVAYLVQGLTNDSFVGTSIFFWIVTALCVNCGNNTEKLESESI